MFTTMLYFLPSVVSLLWFVTFLFKVKSPRQKVLTWILGLGIFYFATYATYINPQDDYLTLVKMDAVNVPVICVLMSLIVLYMTYHLRSVRPSKLLIATSFLPAICLGEIVVVLYYLVGFDNAARLVEFHDKGLPQPQDLDTNLVKLLLLFDDNILNIFSIACQLIAVYLCVRVMKTQGYRFGDVTRFFFKGNSSTPSRVISVLQFTLFIALSPITTLGREFLTAHPVFGAATTVFAAIILHFIAYVEYFGTNTNKVTLHDLSHITSGKEYEANVTDDTEVSTQNTQSVQSTPSTQNSTEEIKEDRLRGRRPMDTELLINKLINLFEKEEIFRQDDLNLEKLSQISGIGRTTLSSLINQHFGMPFRDVINRYRVEAVKKYLLENPAAKQEDAAFHCGFKDASSLNRKFRELENYTPLMWLTHHQSKS